MLNRIDKASLAERKASWSAADLIALHNGGSMQHKHPTGQDLPSPGASWFTQFSVLYVRALRNSIRNPLNTGARILTSTLLGVFVGLVFFQLGSGEPRK